MRIIEVDSWEEEIQGGREHWHFDLQLSVVASKKIWEGPLFSGKVFIDVYIFSVK